MEKIKVSEMEKGIYRGVHPVYGKVAGFFKNGEFIAHQTSLSGSFFGRDVWANDGFKIAAVVDDDAEL